MPGRPVLRELARRIEVLGGEDFVFEQLASGITQAKLADGLDTNRRMVYSWSKMTPERREKFVYYRKLGAGAAFDESVDILDDMVDDPDLNSAKVSLARARSQAKRAYAAKMNPEKYGDKQVIDINVTHSDVHIEALKEANALKEAFIAANRQLGPGSGENVVEAEYELEGEENAEQEDREAVPEG